MIHPIIFTIHVACDHYIYLILGMGRTKLDAQLEKLEKLKQKMLEKKRLRDKSDKATQERSQEPEVTGKLDEHNWMFIINWMNIIIG